MCLLSILCGRIESHVRLPIKQYVLIDCCTHSKFWWTWRESNPLTSRLQGVSATHRPGPCYFRSDQSILSLDKLGAEKPLHHLLLRKQEKFVRIVFVARQPKFSFKFAEPILYLVRMVGLELTTYGTQNRRATRLRYTRIFW